MKGLDQVHTDDLYDVDDCIEINKVSDFFINLNKDDNITETLKYNNGYHPIPKKVIETYNSLTNINILWTIYYIGYYFCNIISN